MENQSELKYQDLVYFGTDWDEEGGTKSEKHQSDFMVELKVRFPNVKFKDCYNEIKGLRQEVYLEQVDDNNYFSWLIGKGWFEFSLTMQVLMMDKDPKQKEKFDKYIALAKKQYPEEFKPEFLNT